MNKQDLISKIKQLNGITQDERAYLINLVNTKKKYGLVWEDKPEDVEEQLRDNLPVLKEVKDKAIINGENNPNHILIEGDNLHALTALTFTHEGKIDVIYIDPPYNTGNKDFKYNDSFVDKEDSYRHSKWLSFMDKRLRIAKRLLSEKGVIFISIDDNEVFQLKLLCDEVFGQNNFVADIIWEKKYSPQNDAKWFSPNHDYILVYTLNKENWRPNLLERNDEQTARYKNPDSDPRGDWKMSDLSVKTYSANYDYPITTPSGRIAKLPSGRCWMTNETRMQELINDNRIWFGKTGDNIPALKRFLSEVKQGVTPMTIWFRKDVGDNQEGKQELLQIIPENLFQTPKVVRLLKKIIALAGANNSITLDFFAGSGTTLHATMALNAEDGGNRQCILVTNNENNICEEVTYERNKRVIKGYTNTKGVAVAGLENNNLRYYKADYVGRAKSLKNKKELTRLATELLCIKEDCYAPSPLTPTPKGGVATIVVFEDIKTQLVVIYDDVFIEDSIVIIKQLKETQKTNTRIKVYVFSNGQYPYTDDFEEVAHCVELCALPDAIYKAYQNVLPKTKRELVPTMEDDVAENDLFTA